MQVARIAAMGIGAGILGACGGSIALAPYTTFGASDGISSRGTYGASIAGGAALGAIAGGLAKTFNGHGYMGTVGVGLAAGAIGGALVGYGMLTLIAQDPS